MAINEDEIKSEGQKIEGHKYDDIEELDNALPRWWINGFYLTVIFAAIYVFHYMLGDGSSLLEEYEHEKKEHEIAQYSEKSTAKSASEDELRALLKEKGRIKIGQEVFQSKCISCHGAQGQGGIGPNLTDDYWIHGGKMTEILNVVSNGVLDKGMPPWGAVIKPEEVQSVTAFIKSLRGSKPTGAKTAQGELVRE